MAAAPGVALTAVLALGLPATSAEPAAQSLTAPTVGTVDMEVMAELRDERVAARSLDRPTSTPAPTAAPTPTVVPIVGTFAPVAGCSATVPADPPANGQVSSDDLCPIGGGHLLRADAAATFVVMNAAFASATGSSLCVTDSYRSLSAQRSLYARKPGLAAVPGTSNHGWGVAVDMFCGVDSYGSAAHGWLLEHGPAYGWHNPSWARAGGSRPEPWHWEFDPGLIDSAPVG